VYRVTLTGPQAGAAPLERTVTVVDGQTVTIGDVKFSPLSTEAYFNLYLASHQEPVASDGAGSGSVEAVSAKAREETR
jgi:hypothetical protein